MRCRFAVTKIEKERTIPAHQNAKISHSCVGAEVKKEICWGVQAEKKKRKREKAKQRKLIQKGNSVYHFPSVSFLIVMRVSLNKRG